MAFSIAQLANLIRTSIHGRRLGLDSNDFLVGNRGLRLPVTDATSDTTGTALPNHGMVSVITTTNDIWTLTDPVPGCQVTIFTGSSSTGTHNIVPAAATIISSNGVAGSSIAIAGAGASIRLVGISTAKWIVTTVANAGSSAGTGNVPSVVVTS
jgi:hypothetical protein